MSKESLSWLAGNVLAGFTDTRPVWWAKYALAEGHAPNLYPAEVPFEKVYELIASWMPVPAGLYDVDVDKAETLYDGDMKPVLAVRRDLIEAVPTHKLIKAADNGERMSVVGAEYAIHSYRDWLTGTVQEILGDEAVVSTAGLLRNRAQAWVQIERPETAVGPDGIKFSPYITLSTSLDYSMPSQQNQNTTFVVCDNTLEIGRTQGLVASVRHTKHSGLMLGDYRSIFARLVQGETDFREELERQLAVKVSDNAFDRFLESFVPIADDAPPAVTTRFTRKRQQITDLYRNDPRMMDLQGTELGVVQAVNTWRTHMGQLRNMTGREYSDTDLRAMKLYAERLKPAKGDSPDQETVKILEAVL